MLKLIFIIIFSIVLLNGNTQNLLIFENLKNGKIVAYKLPLKAKCTFKNGTKRSLILDSIQGDSFYFKANTKKNIVLSYHISSIEKIDNYNSE